MSWLDKTANITRLRHINLHKCWLLAGFLFGNMILWVGIWLEPIWVRRTWLSTNDQPSPLSTFSFSSNWIAKLDQTDTGILLLLLLIPVSVCSASSSRIPEESTSLGLRGRRVQNGRRRGTRMEDAFCRLKKASFQILFLRCKLRLILIFTGEAEGWPRPPCIQSEAVSPKLRLAEIPTLVSESSGVSRTLV